MKPDLLGSVEYTGGTIKRPGVYSNMSISAYHKRDVCDGLSISSSGLRMLLNKSPAHFWAASPLNPNVKRERATRAMVLGRAMHHLAFDQRMFNTHFVVAPSEIPDYKGVLQPFHLKYKAAQEWRDANENEFTDVLFPDDVPKIRGMVRALKAHSFVQNGALGGYVERSAFIKDEETGIWIKVRPDTIPSTSGDFVDLKVTHSVQWPRLQQTIVEQGYVMQFALMRHVFRKLKIPFHSSTLIFVEAEPPHCVRPVTLDEHDLVRGEQANQIAIKRFANIWKEWQRTNNEFVWWGPGGDRADAETMRLPEWYSKQLDDKLAMFDQEETYVR
ncbi:MAG: hypothetical protein C5B60_07820 [Chloroflexi bacterium]|nr:MAG: hypothetical protein C5B60_07820 [Chloroflexota bacterium]